MEKGALNKSSANRTISLLHHSEHTADAEVWTGTSLDITHLVSVYERGDDGVRFLGEISAPETRSTNLSNEDISWTLEKQLVLLWWSRLGW